jgi:hypothetical protein
MAIVLDGTSGITTPDLESSGPVSGTTANFSGNVTLGSSVLATPSGSAPSYTCRAWVNFNGTGTVAIRASGNVTSITDNGTGDYTVNFTNAMADANYCTTINATVSAASHNSLWNRSTTYATGSYRTAILNHGGTAIDPDFVNVAIFR